MAKPKDTDTDPAPQGWVLTDFSDLAQFHFSEVDCTFSMAAPPVVELEPGRLPPIRPVEKVTRSIIQQRRLGHHRWFEAQNITIIRNTPAPTHNELRSIFSHTQQEDSQS